MTSAPQDVVREEPSREAAQTGVRRGRPHEGVDNESRARADAPARKPLAIATSPVVDQLRALEDARRDGTIELPDGRRLGVTNLAKLFWPAAKLTKGDLLRYYAEVAPLHPSGRRRSSAGDEAVSQRRRRHGVLPAAIASGEAAGGRAHRDAARRASIRSPSPTRAASSADR